MVQSIHKSETQDEQMGKLHVIHQDSPTKSFRCRVTNKQVSNMGTAMIDVH